MASQITDQLIAKAMGPGGRTTTELLDAMEPGLRLRIGSGGARWSYRSSVAGESRLRIPLGRWPAVSIADARRLVGRLKVTFDQPAPAESGVLTVAALIDRYDRRRLSQLRKGRVILRAITVALSPVSHREVGELSRRDISWIVDGMADRAPIHANRVLAYLKAFFGWAVGRGYLEANPAAGISRPTREVTRDRTPTLAEVVEIWEAAGELGYPFGPAIRLLILTASRRDEIGAMRACEVNLAADGDEGCWTLPANRSKNGRAIRVPFAPSAQRVLERAMTERVDAGPFVFSTTGTTPISGWSRAKSRIDKLIQTKRRRHGDLTDMAPWRIHDLRRAFATAACDVLQIDPAVADRCLNHLGAATSSTVSRIYARNEMFEQRRDALLKWAQLLARATDKGQQSLDAPTAGTHDGDHGTARSVRRRARR